MLVSVLGIQPSSFFGVKPINFFFSTTYAFPAIMALNIFSTTPYFMIEKYGKHKGQDGLYCDNYNCIIKYTTNFEATELDVHNVYASLFAGSLSLNKALTEMLDVTNASLAGTSTL